jgi:hypothetical protein
MQMQMLVEPFEAKRLVVVEPLEVVITLKHGFNYQDNLQMLF